MSLPLSLDHAHPARGLSACPAPAAPAISALPLRTEGWAGVPPAIQLHGHDAEGVTAPERAVLMRLQVEALQYFLDNQMPNGLFLDRQRNHEERQEHGLCSTATTGMGFIALALASAPPYRLLSRSVAALRIRTGLQAALERLPQDHGMMPHFVHSATHAVHGQDHVSTIDSSWLVAGGLWAATFLENSELESLAGRLYERVDWNYWTAWQHTGRGGLLRHGKRRDGSFLACAWDRLNGETAFMYVLAAGAAEGRAVACWSHLKPFYGTVAGWQFNNADLGLFVFQYSLDLLDLRRWRAPGEVDLWTEARLGTLANHAACRQAAGTFATYQRFWGLSAGDGPGEGAGSDTYRCYAPAGPVDGTAHITATLAAVAHHPQAVLENLHQAEQARDLKSHARYGFSNINSDRRWVGRDMVGVDAGAAVLALDNYLVQDRVRTVFHNLPCVQRGLERLGFKQRPAPGIDSPIPPSMRRAS